MGFYTTYTNDWIVNRVRDAYPNTLPGNSYFEPPNVSSYFFSQIGGSTRNHSFENYFIDPQSAKNLIVSNTNIAIRKLRNPIVCEDVVPCGQSLSRDGGSGPYNYVQSLGNQSGNVSFNFEAYSIKDSIVVKDSAGKTLSSSGGQISGYLSDSFYYDSKSFPSNKVYINVKGNNDSNTRWDLLLGCPGDSLPVTRKNVTFSFGPTQGSSYRCSFNAYVNGKYASNVGFFGRSFSMMLSKGGPHKIEYRNKMCESTGSIPQGGYRGTITESGNSRSLRSPLSASEYDFYIF